MGLLKTDKTKQEIALNLEPTFRVLDVGGGCAPCARADYVLDILPFDQAAYYQIWGGDTMRFTKETWIVRDICHREPWPFPDKYFDYVICSHTLEDIRDPVWVCSELTRVSKAGYIETPSRLAETSYGFEGQGNRLAGAQHHHWILDIFEEKLRVTFKSAWTHLPWIARHTPPTGEDRFLKFEWRDSFECYENVLTSGSQVLDFLTNKTNTSDELLEHTGKLLGYPPLLYKFYRKHSQRLAFLKKLLKRN
jgi:hypothetical protein